MAVANAKQRIGEVVEKLVTSKKELARLLEDEEATLLLGRPCSPQQITSVERALGKPLPPSYRAFLELHNGWDEFQGDSKILAAEDFGSDWLKKRLEEKGGLFQQFTKKNPLSSWAFTVFAGPTSSRLGVLDTRKIGPDGEMPLVTFEYTQQEARFATFAKFLESELKTVAAVIKDEKEGVSDDDEEEEDDDEEEEEEKDKD